MDPRYTYFIKNDLEYISPSVDWSTEIAYHHQNGCTIHRLVFTTCFVGTNHLIVDSIMSNEVYLGNDDDDDMSAMEDPALLETEIEHPNGLVRARFMPQDPRHIAAISAVGEVILYSLTETRYSSERRPEYSKKILTEGNGTAGKALSWNLNLPLLLSATYDGTINIYNTVKQKVSHTFKISNHVPIDACWNKIDARLFGSVGADQTCKLWDSRCPQPCYGLKVHNGAANSIDFSPLYANVFITGGSDQIIAVWDHRFPGRCLSTAKELSPVIKVAFGQRDPQMFASSGLDNEVHMYMCSDTQKVNGFFRHCEHDSTVLDFAWHPFWNAIGSVDQSQEIHVWEPSLAACDFD